MTPDCTSCQKSMHGADGKLRCRPSGLVCTNYLATVCGQFIPKPAPGSVEERELQGLCPNQGRGD